MSLAEENAEFLASIAARGADLSVPRVIDFAHLLYSQFAALRFKRALEADGYQVTVKEFPSFEMDGQEDVWDVVVTSRMVPTVENVTRLESKLGALAKSFGGHSDGWGFDSF